MAIGLSRLSRPCDALADLQADVEALPHVIGTNDPARAMAAGNDVAMSSGVLSPDGTVVLMQVQYPMLDALTAADLDRLEGALDTARAGGVLQVEAGGDLYFAFDEPEAGAEMIGILAAIVILLLAFGSVIAMGLPIGMAIFGLALGIGSMSLVTYVIDIPSWVPDIGAMVGLGVGIDYALFVVTRHREFLARDFSVEESVGRAVATAGQAVVFAGGTVVIAILGLAVAGVPFMTAAGVATSVIVLIMVLASITLLPAFLGLAGHWINRIGIHRRGVHQGDATTEQSTWATLGRPRRGTRVGVRHRRHGAAGGARSTRAVAAPGLPRRGHPARVDHATPRLRPRRRRVRTRAQRTAADRRSTSARMTPSSVRWRPPSQPIREWSAWRRRRRTPRLASRRSWCSRRRHRRTTSRWPPSSGCARK